MRKKPNKANTLGPQKTPLVPRSDGGRSFRAVMGDVMGDVRSERAEMLVIKGIAAAGRAERSLKIQ